MSQSPDKTKAPAKAAPKHYHGHRDRLRMRFLEHGAGSLQDYELLELFLFRAIPRRDVKPLAKKLLEHFGDLHSLCNSSYDELCDIPYLPRQAAIDLALMRAFAIKMAHDKIAGRPILKNWNSLVDYCRKSMGYEKKELLRVLFLNNRSELVKDEFLNEGTINMTPVYPREIIKKAINVGAIGMILVHNHPSGDPTPSQADIDVTKKLARAGEAVNVRLLDHLIITRGHFVSFKNLRLL